MLLALVGAADDLTQLASLHSVDVAPHATGVLLRLGEVQLEGRLIVRSAHVRSGRVAQIERRAGLLICAVLISGNPLLKAVG
jgi:hypothetical protein